MTKLINKKVLVLAMGGIMSIVSVPSVTTVTAVVATTVASFSLTTDAYARKTKDEKVQKHLDKAADAYEKGKTKKGDRQIRKADRAMGYDPDDGDGGSFEPPPVCVKLPCN